MKRFKILSLLLFSVLLLVGCDTSENNVSVAEKAEEVVTTIPSTTTTTTSTTITTTLTTTTTTTTVFVPEIKGKDEDTVSLSDIPEYNGDAYCTINDNKPFFSDNTTFAFELYSDLDSLGRCGAAYANICEEIMPTEKRGDISSIKPSGWHSEKYDWIDGENLYNRCHLIGYQLSGENANEKNLITGTRYMNTEGMLPFENMVADYVKETSNHVLYRVTPMFDGDDLVVKGVLMEGRSAEDEGKGVEFNVFCYNVQPDVKIDYTTGESESLKQEGTTEQYNEGNNSSNEEDEVENNSLSYVVNTNTGKFHYPSCSSAKQIKSKNRWDYDGSRDELIGMGYVPCKRCNP